jgi:hypothetical protein
MATLKGESPKRAWQKFENGRWNQVDLLQSLSTTPNQQLGQPGSQTRDPIMRSGMIEITDKN